MVHYNESFSNGDRLSKKQQPMWDLVEKNDHLDENQRKMLYFLLVYEVLFARDKTDLGRMEKILHTINTEDIAPISQQLRHIAPARRKAIQELLKDMLKKNVINCSTCI